MPTVEENVAVWGGTYDWSDDGEGWSRRFGSTDMLWWGAIFPRIYRFVPAGSILEIAPGYGRFTHYLRSLCDRLTVVDVSGPCIEACQRRFADATNIEYHVNDGRSLDMVPDGSVDFVFSFDSLVHADSDVIESYLHQLADKLTDNGIGFIHHSNVGMYGQRLRRVLPNAVAARITKRINHNWRDERMSLDLFNGMCESAGLRCIVQEPVEWHTPRRLVTDCISTFTAATSPWVKARAVKSHPAFMREARSLAELDELYAPNADNSAA